MIVLQFIFWLCTFLVFYSYTLYPILILVLHGIKKIKLKSFSATDELPSVSVIMTVRNEEKVIEEKILSIINSDYNKEKLELIIGSDASNDHTDDIIKKYSSHYSFIKLIRFEERKGKPYIVNELVEQAKHEIIILTDANVIPTNDCFSQLVRVFKDDKCGLAGANILNHLPKEKGIALQEKFYVQIENKIKFLEGNTFGSMIGPFGGCYAIRKSLYSRVPTGFAVDDFYIGMKVLQQNYDAVLIKQAVCYEDVSSDVKEEFRRKRRIASGNFQNLMALLPLLNPFSATGFCFISHKVIRWFGPVLWLIAFICNALLLQNHFYLYLLFLQLAMLMLVLLDSLTASIGYAFRPLRYIGYFCSMNAALFMGLIDFLKGSNANVWEPTKRN